jgi:hypothetical protein
MLSNFFEFNRKVLFNKPFSSHKLPLSLQLLQVVYVVLIILLVLFLHWNYYFLFTIGILVALGLNIVGMYLLEASKKNNLHPKV